MPTSPTIISFVARSKRRREILAMLSQKTLSQPEIMKTSKMYKSHTSRTLKDLLKKKLIVLLNPDDNAFKFYKATSLGVKVLKEVQKIIGS